MLGVFFSASEKGAFGGYGFTGLCLGGLKKSTGQAGFFRAIRGSRRKATLKPDEYSQMNTAISMTLFNVSI